MSSCSCSCSCASAKRAAAKKSLKRNRNNFHNNGREQEAVAEKEKEFICYLSFCHASFPNSKALVEHALNEHIDYDLAKCRLCSNFTCKTSAKLQEHHFIMHDGAKLELTKRPLNYFEQRQIMAMVGVLLDESEVDEDVLRQVIVIDVSEEIALIKKFRIPEVEDDEDSEQPSTSGESEKKMRY